MQFSHEIHASWLFQSNIRIRDTFVYEHTPQDMYFVDDL